MERIAGMMWDTIGSATTHCVLRCHKRIYSALTVIISDAVRIIGAPVRMHTNIFSHIVSCLKAEAAASPKTFGTGTPPGGGGGGGGENNGGSGTNTGNGAFTSQDANYDYYCEG